MTFITNGWNAEDDSELPSGYRCPVCGNEVSNEESDYGEAILCTRCPNGEYTTMEPYFEETSPALADLYKKMLDEYRQDRVRFNHGKCGIDCNCVEIAESKNGGNPVKSYECFKTEL